MNTNASNQTQFFGFPLFAGTDKPSVLTDWNGTMEELDRTLEDYRVRIAGCEQSTASFMDQVNILKAKFVEVETRISADEGLIQDNALEIIALKEAMIVADTSIKRLLASLTSIETKNAEQDTAIDGINSHLNTVDESLTSLASDITLIESAINNDRQRINTLENVTDRLTGVDVQIKKAIAYEWNANTIYVKYERVFVYEEINGVIVPVFYVASRDVHGVKPGTEEGASYWRSSDNFNISHNIASIDSKINAVEHVIDDEINSLNVKISDLSKPFAAQTYEGFFSGVTLDSQVAFSLSQDGFIYQALERGFPIKIYGIMLYSTGNVFDNPPFLPFNGTMPQAKLDFINANGENQTLTRDLIPSRCEYNQVDNVYMSIVRFTTSSEIYLDPSHLKFSDGHPSMQFKFDKEFRLDDNHTPINFITALSGVTYGGLIFAY